MTVQIAPPPAGPVPYAPELSHALLADMLRIRRLEEKCAELYGAGKIRGFLHLYIGEEAVATGCMHALAAEDNVVATYREHGHALLRGVPMGAIVAEMYGKREGCSRGRGGSMHLFDAATRFYGGNAIVGGGLPLAVGLALAARMKFTAKSEIKDRLPLTACFFGEGAIAEGAFHESMNLAQLWKVPAIFCLENNGWAESTPATQQLPLPVDELGKRASAYGMKLIEADGQDVEAVYLATLAAREHALSGKGPVLLHLRTHRLTGHFVGDPQVYRDKDALKGEWETKDPIKLLGARLEISDAEFAAIDAEVTAEVEAAVEYAKAGTDPAPEDALTYVYA
jgi:pyruvate dehydrogenase E1 component alpha subunit